MREMTDDELESIYGRGECPFCRTRRFVQGPRGGLSVNVTCGGCRARFNICPIPTVGEVLEEPPPRGRA